MRTKVSTALVALGLGAATLTGCGGGDGGDSGDASGGGSGEDFTKQSAEAIVETAKSDMSKLKAVKMSGSLTNDGQEISIDLQAGSGGNCIGSLGLGDGSTEILGVDGKTWMRPDEAFWRTFAGDGVDQLLAIVGDKWVVIPSGEDSFNEFCDVDELLDQLLEEDDSDGSTYEKAGEDELDGDDVIKIDNVDPEDGTSTGFVLVDSPHYLVKIEKTEGDEPGSITFSEFNEEFDVEAPADDEVIDLDSLG